MIIDEKILALSYLIITSCGSDGKLIVKNELRTHRHALSTDSVPPPGEYGVLIERKLDNEENDSPELKDGWEEQNRGGFRAQVKSEQTRNKSRWQWMKVALLARDKRREFEANVTSY